MSIKIYNSPDKVADTASEIILKELNKKAGKNDDFFLAVSGGSTPKLLFQKMAEKEAEFNWSFLHIFWVDERCVPPNDKESNFGMAKEFFLNRIKIPQENIHRIKGENDPVKETERYAEEILNILPQKNNLPVFDLIFLGMGSDGHTASIFPGKNLLFNYKNLTGTAEHPDTGQKRITLTYDLINNAKRIVFLVTGKDKAEMINSIHILKENYPAGKIKPHNDEAEWLLDKEAAGLLQK